MSSIVTMPSIGEDIEGGTYTGAIRIGEQIFGIVVAPKDGGETEAVWHAEEADVPDAQSFFDGKANGEALITAGSEMAQWAVGLQLGGRSDWYVPSRDEMELIYRNLKPTNDGNWRFRGDNPSSVPVGYAYRPDAPAQTTVERFRDGGLEAMSPTWYWSSTQYSADYAWIQLFLDGGQYDLVKGFQARVRAVRRFLIA